MQRLQHHQSCLPVSSPSESSLFLQGRHWWLQAHTLRGLQAEPRKYVNLYSFTLENPKKELWCFSLGHVPISWAHLWGQGWNHIKIRSLGPGFREQQRGEAPPEKGKTPMWTSELPAESLVLKKVMATHSSILAGKVPWTEAPGELQSMGSQRVGHHWATNTCLSKDHIWSRG